MKLLLRLLAVPLLLLAACAGAQEWPAKPVRILIPSGVGGLGELVMRTIAPGIEARLGQRFLVEAKPGAGGAIGATEIARATPDGYNLMLAPTNAYVVLPHILKNISYDPVEHFAPITMIVDAPVIVVVNASLPVRSLKELAAHIRANPGKLNVGSPGAGSPAHILGEFFGKLHGGMLHVPYKGAAPVGIAIQTNEVQVLFPTVAAIQPQLKGGSVRVIAALTRQRIAEFPGVPTGVESGFPELGEAGNWWGLSAPKGTDARIVDRLAAEIRTALADPSVKKRFADVGMVSVGSTPAEFGQFIRSELARWKRVVEKAGIQPE
jgi:tripartite-type tricarboxylate transporter receptor subunit TctC